MDNLIERIEVELDPDVRRDHWAELQRLYAEELPALPLFFHSPPCVRPHWLRGVEPTGHLYPSSLWVEQWRAAK